MATTLSTPLRATVWAPASALTTTARCLGLAPGLLWGALGALAWERAWRQLWPLAPLTLGFLALAWSGGVAALPAWGQRLLPLALWTATAVLLVRAVLTITPPRTRDALRRLEDDAGLRHQPLTLLLDQPATPAASKEGATLWRLAQARARRDIATLRPPWPRPGVAARDPWALRHLALLLAVCAGVAAGDAAGPRLADALRPPPWSAPLPSAAPALEVWITPPAYTGLSPRFLTHRAGGNPQDATAPLVVPDGAVVTVNLPDGGPPPHLDLGSDHHTLAHTAAGWRSDLTLGADRLGDTRLTVRQAGLLLGEWRLRVVADQPPVIAFHTPPAATERYALRLDYTAADDYGLVKVGALIQPPAGIAGADPIDLPLPLASPAPRTATGTGYADLTASPWAGRVVQVRLYAIDGAGHKTLTPPLDTPLPERAFHNPVAQAVIAQRKALIVAGEAARPTVSLALLDIAAVPGGYGGDPTVFMNLYAAARRLDLDRDPTAVAEVVDMLWQVALSIEDGRVATAESDLRDAQNRLMDALNHKAPPAEVTRALDALRQAMARYVSAMAQRQGTPPEGGGQGQKDGGGQRDASAQGPDGAPTADLDQMMQQLRDLAEGGDREAAKRMLDQIQSLMENLRTDGPTPQEQAQAAQARQSLQALAGLAARQRSLMDDTFRQTPREDNPSNPGTPPGVPPDGMGPDRMSPEGRGGVRPRRAPSNRPAAPTSSSAALAQDGDPTALVDLARRQQALERELADLPSAKNGQPGALAPAARAMAAAGDALARGDAAGAVAAQAHALAALEQGLRDLARQMMAGGGGTRLVPRAPGSPPGGEPEGGDPLGRALPGQGINGGDEVRLPTQPDIKRVRQILDELRRRADDPNRPQEERDYIDRLLNGL